MVGVCGHHLEFRDGIVWVSVVDHYGLIWIYPLPIIISNLGSGMVGVDVYLFGGLVVAVVGDVDMMVAIIWKWMDVAAEYRKWLEVSNYEWWYW